MRRTCAIGLSLMLGLPWPAAAAGEPPPEGPLMRSVASEASRLAADAGGGAPEAPGWKAVRTLDPATPIVVVTATATGPRTFVAADDTTLIVLNLSLPTLTKDSRHRLTEMARQYPASLVEAAGGRAKIFESITINDDGVFLAGAKLAERDELIEQLPVANIQMVTTGPVRHGSAGAAVAGTLGGLVFGPLLAVSLFGDSRHGSLGEFALLGLAYGTPVATGYGAWRASSRVTEEVIYMRPAAAVGVR